MDILQNLTKILSLLPNIGPRAAKRIIITLAKEKNITNKLIELLQLMKSELKECSICKNLCQGKLCNICKNSNRDHNQICIVSDIANLWAIEKTGTYEGVFHLIEEANSIEQSSYIENEIMKRINGEPQEFIIAMNPTIQGQAFVHYIQSVLKEYDNITISTLALGIPMGSELDYLDSGTISIAINSRKEIS